MKFACARFYHWNGSLLIRSQAGLLHYKHLNLTMMAWLRIQFFLKGLGVTKGKD